MLNAISQDYKDEMNYYVKVLEQCLAYTECSINVNCLYHHSHRHRHHLHHRRRHQSVNIIIHINHYYPSIYSRRGNFI